MDLKAKVQKHAVVYSLSLLVAAFAAGWTAHVAVQTASGRVVLTPGQIETRVSDAVEVKMATWEFTKPLYAVLPNDIDFLVRNIRISLHAGDAVTIVGPGSADAYSLSFSQVHKLSEDSWSAVLQVNGRIGTNEVRNLWHQFVVKSGAHTEGMGVLSHEFYAVVEDVNPDGIVTLALGRRPVATWIQHNVVYNVGGNPISVPSGRPEPIVCRKAAE
jgi:hypothetical protein